MGVCLVYERAYSGKCSGKNFQKQHLGYIIFYSPNMYSLYVPEKNIVKTWTYFELSFALLEIMSLFALHVYVSLLHSLPIR